MGRPRALFFAQNSPREACASGERGFMVAMACTAGKQGLVSLEEIRPPLASLVLNILALTIASHSEICGCPSKGFTHKITA